MGSPHSFPCNPQGHRQAAAGSHRAASFGCSPAAGRCRQPPAGSGQPAAAAAGRRPPPVIETGGSPECPKTIQKQTVLTKGEGWDFHGQRHGERRIRARSRTGSAAEVRSDGLCPPHSNISRRPEKTKLLPITFLDGQRNEIFADAFGKDPQFFSFYRAMQSYEKALIGGETSLVLSPDSDFFKFFGKSASPAVKKR